MPQLSVRMPNEFVPHLTRRGEKAQVIRESVDRYFALLERARVGLRETFTPDELSLLVLASKDVCYKAWSIPHMAMSIEDANRLGNLDKTLGVDSVKLLEKLRGLDLASTFALVDALEVYWEATRQGISVSESKILW